MKTTVTQPLPQEVAKKSVQPQLETDRLLLRAFEIQDAPEIQRLAGDFAIADTTSDIPHPYPVGAAEAFITLHARKFAQNEAVVFALTDKHDGRLIGGMGLNHTPRFRRAELGYWIGRPYWNRGYASEAGKAVIQFAFEYWNVHKIEASYFARNPASGQVMKKLGMVQEGLLRDHILKWNRLEDLVVYGLVRS